MELKHKCVRFRVLDVYIPNPQEVLVDLYRDDVISGEVVDLSNGGAANQKFAMVKVEGLTQLLIVPVDRLLGVGPARQD